jgi:uncharacterized membrane protein YsdA (DUF1294 family)
LLILSFSFHVGNALMNSRGSLGRVLLCDQLLRLIDWLWGGHLWWRFEELLLGLLEMVFGRLGSFVGHRIQPSKLER